MNQCLSQYPITTTPTPIAPSPTATPITQPAPTASPTGNSFLDSFTTTDDVAADTNPPISAPTTQSTSATVSSSSRKVGPIVGGVVGGVAFIAMVIGLTWYAFRRGRKIGQQEVANSSNYRAPGVGTIKAAEKPGGNLGENESPQEKTDREEATMAEPSELSARLRYLDEPGFGTAFN
jgi:hypothetical protein